ncbi:MAG: TRAP transporter small permease [Candidatus Accumulibacter sp.]|jgi:TRAP-type C4-dicarboxylate transport system permease small subunit|nr:TRAP transporter small permease [Accumulibacter sp.]
MPVAEKVNSILEAVFKTLEWLSRIILVVMTLLVSAQVISRSYFNFSIKWAEEVSLICMIYITFFTLALGVHYDSHLRIEMFVQWLPKKGRRALEFINNLLMLFIAIMMTYYGWRLAMYGRASLMPATHVATTIIYIPTPVAGFVSCVHLILRIFGMIPASETAKAYMDRNG